MVSREEKTWMAHTAMWPQSILWLPCRLATHGKQPLPMLDCRSVSRTPIDSGVKPCLDIRRRPSVRQGAPMTTQMAWTGSTRTDSPSLGACASLVKLRAVCDTWGAAHDTHDSDADADARRIPPQCAGDTRRLPRGDPPHGRGLALAGRLDFRPLAGCDGPIEHALSLPEGSRAAG